MPQTTKQPRAVIYARVSSENQDVDMSILTQINRAKAYIKECGYLLVGTYKDEARTGTVDDRDGFLDMISDARQKPRPFEFIVVINFARFARDRYDSAVYKGTLRKLGVFVQSIEQPNDGSPEGDLMEGIFESFDAYYSANLGRYIQHSLEGLVEQGFYPIRKPPYGYNKKPVQDGQKTRYVLEINESQAAVVRQLFELYRDGKATNEIPTTFNEQGIPSPDGGKWPPSTVHRMLRREIYKGTMVFPLNPKPGRRQVRLDFDHLAIIPPKEFKAVQDMMDERSPEQTHPRHTGSNHLLSGKIKCNRCSNTVVVINSKNGDYDYYLCNTKRKQGIAVCDCTNRNAEELDALILDAILDDILTGENVRLFINRIKDEMRDQGVKHEDTIAAIEKQIQELEGRFERLTIAYETGAMPLEIFAKRMEVLEDNKLVLHEAKKAAMESVGSQLRLLQDPEAAVSFAAELKDCLRQCETKQLKHLLGRFIKQVRIDYDKAIIVYKIPLPDDSHAPRKTRREIDLTDPVHTSVQLAPPSLLNPP